MESDESKVNEMVLALLFLNSFKGEFGMYAWKNFDWDTMDRLYEKEYIGDPKGKAKSVFMTEEGFQLGKALFEKHFGIESKNE